MPKAENDGSLVLPHYLQRKTKARLEGKAKDRQKKPQQSVWEDLCSGKALQSEGFSRLRAGGVSCHQVPLPQQRAWPKTAAWLMHKQWRSSLRFGRSRQPVLELPRMRPALCFLLGWLNLNTLSLNFPFPEKQ